MSLYDAARASRAFLAALDEAQHMAGAGQVGAEFDEVLQHASELLDLMDEELADVDRAGHPDLFAAAPILRAKLEAFRPNSAGRLRTVPCFLLTGMSCYSV